MPVKDIVRMLLHAPSYLHNKKKKDREYIQYVKESSGWTLEETKAAMNKAKAEGISYKYYAKRRLWTRTEAQMELAKKNVIASHQKNLEERRHAKEVVMAATGWSQSVVEEKIREANLNCGSSAKDYYKFRLYELTPEEQREYLTLGIAEALSFKYNPDPEALRTLRYKGRFAKKYNDLFHRIWFRNVNLTYEDFLKYTQNLDSLICKPLASTQGKGIVKLNFSDYKDKKAIYDELMNMKKVICEECIVQHPDIAAFNPSSVNTIRVQTLVENGKCHHLYAGFRMGRGALVDNFHAGGIIASIDVKTGITCMDAIDLDGVHYPVHPESKLPTLGFQIPHWDKVLEMTENAALRLENVGLVGWDVAITRDGPCLVEGNSEASYVIIQLPYVDSRIGMRKLFSQFLDESDLSQRR